MQQLLDFMLVPLMPLLAGHFKYPHTTSATMAISGGENLYYADSLSVLPDRNTVESNVTDIYAHTHVNTY